MKTLAYKKNFGLILLAITSVLPSCYPEYEQEIIKKLEAPAWIEAEAKYNGFIMLTWPPVEGAVSYDIYESESSDFESNYKPRYQVGSTEMTTFTYYNPNWKTYSKNTYKSIYYGVRMVDDKGNVSNFKVSRSIQWTVNGQ